VSSAGVTGVQSGAYVVLSVPTNFTDGLTAESSPGGSNVLQVRICNVSANPITDSNPYSFGYLVIH
jgi:hypothetical protein